MNAPFGAAFTKKRKLPPLQKCSRLTERLNTQPGLVLKGWLELQRQAKTNVSQYFESSGSGNPEAIFGKAEALKRAGDLHKALDVVNQGVVSFPGKL